MSRGSVFAVALLVSLFTAAIAIAAKGELSFQQRVPEFDIGTATGVAASPDGAHLYAAGGDSITVLRRTAASGDFAFVEAETDGVDDATDPGAQVDGLDSTTGVAVSPDGAYVYASGWQPDNSIAVFARDAATGRLSFVEVEKDGVNDAGDPGGTVDFLFRAEGVAVSPDGETVYSISSTDDSVVAFARDAATGEISYLEAEVDAVNDAGDPGGTVDGMQGAEDVTVSPDSEAVYVATQNDDSVVAFARDTTTGELNFLEFERDGADDVSDPGGTVNGLNGAEAVAVSPDNDVVYASGRVDSAVAVFARDPATERLSFIEAEVLNVDDAGDLGGTVTGILSPIGIAVSPDGDNLYVAGSSSNAVAVFRYNPGPNELVFIESETDGVNDPSDGGGAVSGLAIPQVLTVSPDGNHVYVAGNGFSGLTAFARTPSTAPTFGSLSFMFTKPQLSLKDPRGMALTPDGEHLIISTSTDESLRAFDRDPASGAGGLVDTETEAVDDPSDAAGAAAGLEEPKAVAVSPDGTHVYVTDTETRSISTFRFTSSTGELAYVETEEDGIDDPGDPGGPVAGLSSPWDVVVAPDGSSVYLADEGDNSVVAFARDPATGRLSFVEAELDGVGGVDGMNGARALAISPDGENVYVTGTNEQATAVFSRNAANGQLTFVEVERQGVDDATDAGGTVDGLESGPEDVTVSRDGDQVYFASSAAVAVFDRDPGTGRLSFAEVERNGIDDPTDPGGAVDGLLSGAALATSADGAELYVGTGAVPGTLLSFRRDGETGRLSFLEVERVGSDDPGDAGGTVAGLDVTVLAVSPDDRHVYALSEDVNSLTIFDREDDFAPPETTITSGPADGAATADSTPAFGIASSETPSTFACRIDGGAPGACPESLPPLADGSHSFSVTATDAEGNTDPSPASRSFTVDTTLSGGKVTAKKKQKQKGEKIKVKLDLEAGEPATATTEGRITVGKKSYGLRAATVELVAGTAASVKLKPKKSAHKAKIAEALERGKKVKASLTTTIADPLSNELVAETAVTLKRKG